MDWMGWDVGCNIGGFLLGDGLSDEGVGDCIV